MTKQLDALKAALKAEIQHERALLQHAGRMPEIAEDSPSLETFAEDSDKASAEYESWQRRQTHLESRARAARNAILAQGSQPARELFDKLGTLNARLESEIIPAARAQVLGQINNLLGSGITYLPGNVWGAVPQLKDLIAAAVNLRVNLLRAWTFGADGRQVLRNDYNSSGLLSAIEAAQEHLKTHAGLEKKFPQYFTTNQED